MTLPYLNTRDRAKRPAFDGYWRYDGFSFVHLYSRGFCAQGFCGGLLLEFRHGHVVSLDE